MKLNNEEINRYSRHLTLPEVGMAGQLEIKESRVLMIGAGRTWFSAGHVPGGGWCRQNWTG